MFCKFYLSLVLCIFSLLSFAQKADHSELLPKDSASNFQFLDTSNFFVSDSFSNNLGTLLENKAPKYLFKKIKYIGSDSILILKAWTNDPHFICGHPKEFLVPGKEYKIRICFNFKGHAGPFRKRMGFRFSNGEVLSFYFTGFVEQSKNK